MSLHRASRQPAPPQAKPLYADPATHELLLRLAAALLLSPDGLLDALALPKDAADTSLQRAAVVLVEHLSHPDNAPLVARLLGGGSSRGVAVGSGAAAAGLRRLVKLAAAGLFAGDRLARERGGQLASGAYGSAAKAMVGGGGRPQRGLA